MVHIRPTLQALARTTLQGASRVSRLEVQAHWAERQSDAFCCSQQGWATLTDNQDVKFFVLPDGYRVEANGTVKVYPLIRGLDLKFETEVASELGLDPKRVISAIDRAGGLKPELADEWAYGAEEYAETAKA